MCAKASIPLIAIALLLASGLGCGGIKPGSDVLIVNAERAEEATLTAVDTFLSVESANHEYFKAKAPAVTHVADQLRREFPEAWKQYRTALGAYAAGKAPADKAALEDRLNQLAALAKLAREQLTQAESVKR